MRLSSLTLPLGILAGAFIIIDINAFVTRQSIASCTSLAASPKPLATQGDWSAYLDSDNTGVVYYFNSKTGESLWEPPEGFPKFSMSQAQLTVAAEKQAKYRESQERQESKQGFFASLLGNANDEEETAVVEAVDEPATTEEPKWFEGLFDKKKEEDTPVVAQEPADEGQSNGFFSSLFSSSRNNGEGIVVDDTLPLETSTSFSGNGIFGSAREEKAIETATATAKQAVTETKKEAEKQDSSAFSLGSLFAPKGETEKVDNYDDDDDTEEEGKKNFSIGGFFGSSSPKSEVATLTLDSISVTEQEEVVPVVIEKVEKVQKVEVPKIEELVDEAVSIDMSSLVLPHPAKVSWGGEDAVFTNGRNFGVFDGVSGAEKTKGLPLYSKTLATEMKKLLGQSPSSILDMTTRLTEAAELANVCSTGASTAILGSLSDDGYLRVLNLGDSACVVLRDGKVAVRSRDIIHSFDCPFQLSDDSPDRPRQGTRLETKLQKGDVVLMASDGIFDNLSEDLIAQTVVDAPAKASSIAKRIVDKSRKVSLDKNAETPFAKVAQRAGMSDYSSGVGGKVDDISCVVVRCK